MIREATTDDVEKITEIHVRSWQSAYRGLLPNIVLDNINYEERNQMWRRTICQSSLETVVADIDSTIAGFANFGSYRGDDSIKAGEIRAIYFYPSFGEKVLGTELLVHATKTLKKDYDRVLLWVLS